jgi:hypothetical protein
VAAADRRRSQRADRNPIYVSYDHIQKLDGDERKERIAARRVAAARRLAESD